VAAVHIRLDGAAVASAEAVGRVAGIEHLDAQLVPEHTRVGKKRLPPGKRVQIGAAHADAVDAHERRAGRGSGLGTVGGSETTGLFKDNGEHRKTKS
jgi:hypothetical protein